MHDPHEEELRIAVAEGLVSRQEAATLGEEARRLGRGPLTLLHERGQISDQTLAALRPSQQGPAAGTSPSSGAPTLEPTSPPKSHSPAVPPFPFPGWERYQGLRFLGQGGMGQVFLAYDPRLRRDIALKFVKGDDAGIVRRLLSEAQAQARVKHERVCQVYEVGEIQGRSYIAMQFIDGVPLGQLAGTLTVEQQALVLRDVAEGVHDAHRAGLIHRDLKPSNILVERTADGRLKPYVMDFGLAHDWTAQGTTATGAVLGTPHYMSPEQARGEVGQLDRRADVYSLGATLYHLLTGQFPIPGTHGLEVLHNIAAVEPRPPRALNPSLPQDLEAIVLKCLEKDRSARYASARALAEDLDHFVSGEPVRARPTGLGYRLRKKARKHRFAVGGATVALLLVAGALGWAGFTRLQAAQRERLTRRFTEQVERIEALARYSGMSRLHDVRADRAELRRRMAELEQEGREAGPLAAGPGNYALGHGYLALGEKLQAREHLERAWSQGFREPRVAWALALILGSLYRDQLLEAEALQSAERRQARRQDLEHQYRDPALAYLRQSQGAEVPSTEYVAALLAFHENRLDDALAHLDSMGSQLPWFHEAPLLRGSIFQLRAQKRGNQGDREGALADLESGRQTLSAAIATGESFPEAHLALTRLEYTAMVMELYGRGDIMPCYTRGLEAVTRALRVDPDSSDARFWEARFHNRLAEYQLTQGIPAEEALQKAITTVRQVLAVHPEHAQARRELGQSLWRQARSRQSLGLDPNEPLRQAIETLEALAPQERDYEFHALLGLIFRTWADSDAQTGADPLPHYAKAIEAYHQAIQLDERLADAWINLGQAYLKRAANPRFPDPEADLEQARLALEKSRTLNPGNFVVWFLGGMLHTDLASRRRRTGRDPRPDLATAAELFQRGIGINPRIAPLHNGLGIALQEQAREAWDRGEDPFSLLARAQAAYEQAITVAPKHGHGQNNVGEIHATRAAYQLLLGEDPTAEARAAEAFYQQASELLPGLANPWANRAKVRHTRALFELEQGRDPRAALTEAEEALTQAFQRNRDEPEAWRYQGEVHAVRARWLARQRPGQAETAFQEAARAMEKAFQLAPQPQDDSLALGHLCGEWARWRKKTGQDATAPLERGLALADSLLSARPAWPEALLLQANLLMERDAARSQKNLQAALTANPHLTHWWKIRFSQ
ncbi:protein kinase [Stigmatella sp. ncwal1]|uniref:Protein kinase n=1 Tax=Stigmatella ashevillensis TaxID=2995309 RepID=A0ABT5DG60_9BACT|nr:serine/threonine-protein kinase [Stigmatella ashevillena]MDC0712115.1 protein kinase [Stigmatella ashevillena]